LERDSQVGGLKGGKLKKTYNTKKPCIKRNECTTPANNFVSKTLESTVKREKSELSCEQGKNYQRIKMHLPIHVED